MNAANPTYPAVPFGSQRLGQLAQTEVKQNRRPFYFYLAISVIFLRISMLHEVIAATLHLNTYALYILAPPVLIAALLNGGFRRTMQSNAARLWIAFFIWMVIATPLSVWRGGSFALLFLYMRTELPMLFVLAAIPMNWKDCRAFFYTIAAGAVVNVLVGRFFMISDYGGQRMSLAFGTISNSNDYAAHLLLVLPFLGFVIASKQVKLLFRLICGGALLYGLFLTLSTASRGALIALLVSCIYILWRGSVRLRYAFAIAMPVTLAVGLLILPRSVLKRLGTFSTQSDANSPEAIEAIESTRAREYLFQISLQYTLEHPFFGVGPGQFSTYEGQNERTIGSHGYWHETHSILTQVSSECGIPALIFFVSALIATMVLFNRTYRLARANGFKEIALASACATLSLLAFVTATLFLNFAYRFYFPAMTGLAIGMYNVLLEQIRAAKPAPMAPLTAQSQSLPRISPVAASPSPSRQRYRFGRLR